jgi:pimeloyl-ACP methyl ester carboxylesterase
MVAVAYHRRGAHKQAMPYAVGPRGTRIWYRVVGDRGDDVVLVQGLGLSSRFWFDQPELLAEDPERPRRVLVLDNRGTGRSDKPRPPYRMAEMADDVVAAMDAARMRRAFVVGISMGGMIAQHVALRHRKRVDGLVLLATTPGLPHGRPPRVRDLATLLSMPIVVPRRGAAALASILLPAAEMANARELMQKWPAALREDVMTPMAFLGQVAAILAHSTGFRLKNVDVPAVVVGAEEDILVPVANSRTLASLLPDAHLELLRAGHGIPLTHRDVVHRALCRLCGVEISELRAPSSNSSRA